MDSAPATIRVFEARKNSCFIQIPPPQVQERHEVEQAYAITPAFTTLHHLGFGTPSQLADFAHAPRPALHFLHALINI